MAPPSNEARKFDEALLGIQPQARATSYRLRNVEMAKEFQKRMPSWDGEQDRIDGTAIGKTRGLERSASIEAVNKGLKIVRSKAKPDN